jgi:hypothetical protein
MISSLHQQSEFGLLKDNNKTPHTAISLMTPEGSFIWTNGNGADFIFP